MFIEVLVGAAISLVLLVVVVGFALRRAPLLFVADTLPERLHSGADEVGELLSGSDGSDRPSSRRASADRRSTGVDEAGLDTGDRSE